ncbi:MAG: hypothetical protein RLZ98_3272 [Pseudomonadota bacterium]|jgi:hypothetical protein
MAMASLGRCYAQAQKPSRDWRDTGGRLWVDTGSATTNFKGTPIAIKGMALGSWDDYEQRRGCRRRTEAMSVALFGCHIGPLSCEQYHSGGAAMITTSAICWHQSSAVRVLNEAIADIMTSVAHGTTL